MGKTAIGYGNLIDAATLSGSGWSVSHPITNLQTRDLAEYAETTGSTAEVIIDHGQDEAAQLFCLFAHAGVAADATIGVTRGTTSEGFDVFASDAEPCWPFSPLGGDRDGSHFGLFLIAPTETEARYTKIVVSGSATMRFGRPFVGRLFVPTYNPNYGATSDGWMEPNSVVDRLQNGADRVWASREQRSAPFDYSALTKEQGSLFHEIVRTHGITGEVVYLRDTVDRAAQQQYGFLALMRKLSQLENPFFNHKATAVALDERGGAP